METTQFTSTVWSKSRELGISISLKEKKIRVTLLVMWGLHIGLLGNVGGSIWPQTYNHYRVIFNTLFGLSVNFWMAISTRFLLGAFNGLLGPIKAYAYEVCREEHQAIGLSTIATAWGIGLIVGPAVGGLLAHTSTPTYFRKNRYLEG